MIRARQTAEILAGLTGLKPSFDDRFREINVGHWSGRTIADIAALDPEFVKARQVGRYHRRGDGETAEELGIRFAAGITDAVTEHPGQTIVIVAHGLAIQMGTARFLGWPLHHAFELGDITNCSWTILKSRHTRWILDRYNVTATR
jgi:probable phosphoglycerate mutase